MATALLVLLAGMAFVYGAIATTDLSEVCADPAKVTDPIYVHLCQIHDEIVDIEEALNQMMGAEETGVPQKRKNEFIRFGKRKNEFIRFGKRKNEFIRFGKRKNEFIRFGKRKNEFIRFGRSAEAAQPHDAEHDMKKRKNEFIRFG